MKAIDIINETVEYYKTNPRGKSDNSAGCDYLTPEGYMCAVGRCLKKKVRNSLTDFYGDAEALMEEKGRSSLDSLLLNKYKNHSTLFWMDLQFLHDAGNFWDKNNVDGNNLTERGKDQYAGMLITYAND